MTPYMVNECVVYAVTDMVRYHTGWVAPLMFASSLLKGMIRILIGPHWSVKRVKSNKFVHFFTFTIGCKFLKFDLRWTVWAGANLDLRYCKWYFSILNFAKYKIIWHSSRFWLHFLAAFNFWNWAQLDVHKRHISISESFLTLYLHYVPCPPFYEYCLYFCQKKSHVFLMLYKCWIPVE